MKNAAHRTLQLQRMIARKRIRTISVLDGRCCYAVRCLVTTTTSTAAPAAACVRREQQLPPGCCNSVTLRAPSRLLLLFFDARNCHPQHHNYHRSTTPTTTFSHAQFSTSRTVVGPKHRNNNNIIADISDVNQAQQQQQQQQQQTVDTMNHNTQGISRNDLLHNSWRSSAQRSSEIRELLEESKQVGGGGGWDDETWWKAGAMFMDRFPSLAKLFLQLHGGSGDTSRNDNTNTQRVLQEPLQLFRRLCQERPKAEPTSQLVNSFLTVVHDLILYEQQSLQQHQQHYQQEHQGGPRNEYYNNNNNTIAAFCAIIYTDAIQHVVKNRYWHPDTTTAYRVLLQLAAAAPNTNPERAELWLSQMLRASRVMLLSPHQQGGLHLPHQQQRIEPPNRYDYTAVVQAYARASRRSPAAYNTDADATLTPIHAAERVALLVRQWLKTYSTSGKDPLLKPTEAAYTGWIVCLTNDAAVSSGSGTAAAQAAERVLQEIWQRSEQDDFWPSATIYNAVIHAWAKAGNAEQAEAVLRDLCERAVSFSVVAAGAGRRNNNDNFTTTRKNYCMPDATSFTTVIAAWSKSNIADAPERAERLLRLMQEFAVTTGLDSVQPNVVTITAVLNCWAKSNRLHAPARAEAILRRMQEHAAAGNLKLRPNAITYNICMNAWSRSGHGDAPEKVEALFQELYEQYRLTWSDWLKPDRVTYMARINAWERSRVKNPRVVAINAAAVLEEMMATNDPTVYPTELHFNRVIAGWTRCGDAVAADALLERMLDDYLVRGIKLSAPSISSFHFVMSAWSKRSSPEAAEQAENLLKRMQQLSKSNTGHIRVKPNLISFNTCLGAWARSGAEDAFDRARLLLQRMNDCNMTPDVYSYGALLQIVAKSSGCQLEPDKRADNARVILAEMETAGLELNEFMIRLAAQCGVITVNQPMRR